MVPICTEWWCTEVNEATQTHCYNPVTPAYPIWVYAHGWQRRCQEDAVSLPSGRLETTTRSSLHHVAQHRPTGYETTPPYAPRSSRFGSEPPSVEDDVDIWRYAIVRLACQKRRRRTNQPSTAHQQTYMYQWFIVAVTLYTAAAVCDAGGDQGLLNQFFSEWARQDINRRLPFIYNVVSQQFYTYQPAFKQ